MIADSGLFSIQMMMEDRLYFISICIFSVDGK